MARSKKKPVELELDLGDSPDAVSDSVPDIAPEDSPLYGVLKSKTHTYSPEEVASLLGRIDEGRYRKLAKELGEYISVNLLKSVKKRGDLSKYRTNPYVFMASAFAMQLTQPDRLSEFIFNNKLYAGLETSFGKSIEKLFVSQYPIDSPETGRWIDPPEKVSEAGALKGLKREEKARRRVNSVWREIDKSCVVADRRFLVSIKSGPNCINDTQVQGMTDVIATKHGTWLAESKKSYPGVTGLDIVVGITYGTDKTTNNKENQILAKLLEHGFKEEDRKNNPGVLIDSSGTVRVYRCIGQDFWSLIGNPVEPQKATFVFLETLLAVVKGLWTGLQAASLRDEINMKLAQLSAGFAKMMFPHERLPIWASDELNKDELFLLATSLTAFYDQGI